MSEKLFILGHPVGHSKSPAMYNAVYSKMGLDWTYDFADIEDPQAAQDFVNAKDYLSINITTPYKKLAFEAATANAASAKLAQGANVLVHKGDALVGFNTDGEGCVGALEHAGVQFAGKKVVVCGTGPTSLAIYHAAATAGAESVLLLSRDRDRSNAAVEAYVNRLGALFNAASNLKQADIKPEKEGYRTLRETFGRTLFLFGSYETSTEAIAEADVIINATPLGMKEGDPAPFDTALLSGAQVVFDCIYGHGETALVAAAKAVGAKVYNGAGMLVAQAVATVYAVCELAAVDIPFSRDELFDMMAAAGFPSDIDSLLRLQ